MSYCKERSVLWDVHITKIICRFIFNRVDIDNIKDVEASYYTYVFQIVEGANMGLSL